MPSSRCELFFFFNDTATTEIYTLSLHDALPIFLIAGYSGGGSSAPYIASNRPPFTHTAVLHGGVFAGGIGPRRMPAWFSTGDRKSTRLNSSHLVISYAVFCLKKKNVNAEMYCD